MNSLVQISNIEQRIYTIRGVIPSRKQLVGCNKRSALHRMAYGAMPVGYCALRGLRGLGKKWFAFSKMEMSAITMLARVKV